MPVFEVELEDGRIVELESESEPTPDQVYSALQSQQPAPASSWEAMGHPLGRYMDEPKPRQSLEPIPADFGLPASFQIPEPQYETDPRLTGQPRPAYEPTLEERRAMGITAPPETMGSFFSVIPEVFPRAPTVEETPVGAIESIAAKAMAPIPSLVMGEDLTAQMLRQGYNLSVGLPEFMMSRLGVAAMPAGAVAPRLTAALFSGDMLRSALEQSDYLQQNWGNMTGLERVRALTDMGFGAALAGMLARHSLKQPQFQGTIQDIIKGTTSATIPPDLMQGGTFSPATIQPSPIRVAPGGQTHARTYPATTTVHGDVLKQPGQSSWQVPVQVSRPGVQPQAEEVAEEATTEVLLTERAGTEAFPTTITLSRLQEVRPGPHIGPEQTGTLSQEASDALDAALEQHSGRKVKVLSPEDIANKPEKLRPGEMDWMVPNWETGTIEIIPSALERRLRSKVHGWWRRGQDVIPKERWTEEIGMLLAHEDFHWDVHSTIGEAGARRYWGNLTPLEQRLAIRYYLGNRGRGRFTNAQLGHEIIRRRLERLEGMEPSELRRTVGLERWELRSIEVLEDIIRGIRETTPVPGQPGLGTEAARANQRLLARVDRNLAIAKEAAMQTKRDEPEGEAPFGTERGKPREAVDESGVTERQFLAGIDRAKRMDFHKDFPQLLPGKIVEEIRELEARLEDPNLNANQIEDIKHEIDMLEEELRIIPDAADVSGVPDMTPEDVLYDRLTHAPYRLPAEQVRNIIDDYHAEGRKLLYDIEPGLGRLYDLTAKGEKYRYFEPVEGDFQLYGQGPAGTFRGKRELPKLGVKWDITNPRSLDKLTLGNLYALIDKENRFIKFEKDRLGEEESSPILQRFYEAKKAYSDAIKRKTGEDPSEAGPAGTVRGRRGEPLDKWIKGTILLDSVRGQEVKKPLPEHSAIGLGRGTRWTFDPTRQVVRWTDTPTREHVDLVSEWLWKNHKVVPDRHESWITSEVLYPEYSPGGPGLGPAGTTRGRGMSKKGQEQARLNALRVAAAEGKAVPAAEAVAAMQAEAFEPVTAHRAQEFVTEYLSKAPAGAKAKLREKSEVIRVGGRKMIQKRYEPGGRVGISFEDFAAKFRTQFGAVPDSQLRELFFKNAGEALAKLPGKRLADLVRDLKVVKILTGGGKPGEKMLQNIGDPGQKGRQLELGFSSGGKALNFAVRRAATAKAKEAQYTELLNEAKAAHQAIVDAGWRDVTDKGELVALSPREKVKVRRIAAPEEIQGEVRALLEARTRLDDFVYDLIGDRPMPKPMFEPGPPRRITRHTEALRAKAIGAIVTELQKQAETSRKPVTRTEISPDELANPATAKEPVFFDIRTSELTDLDRLGQRLTSDARVAGANVEDSRRLVVLLSKESGRVTMASIWDTLKEPGVVVKLGDARTPLSAVLKTHRPVHSILLDEPVRAFRKTYSSLSEFNREFGNAARERAQSAQYEHLPMEDVEEGLGPGRGTTGRRAVPGELLEGEGQIRPSGGVAGPQAAQARMEMGIEPGELGAERRLTDAEAARTYDYATSVVKEFRSPQDFQEVLESLEMDAGELPISKQSTQVIAALNKMFHAILAKNPEFTPGQAMERLSHELYESVRASASAEPAVARARFVQSVLGRYGGAIPEVGRQAPVSPTARELAAPRPGERIRPGIEGVRPALQARPRIEGVGGGLRETMARGAQVHVTPEAATQARARRIARSGVQEESRFARMVREMAEDVRQVEAEVAKEVPRLEGETTEQWVERVRENVARLEHYAATRREAGPAGTQRGKASDLWRKAQEADAIEAESVERWLFGPSRGFAEWYSGWLSQNIRRHGRVASGQAADMADVALDRVKELLAGLNPRLNDALVLSGGTKEIPLIQQVPTPKQLAATKWLNHIDIIPVGDRTTAVSRTVDAIEGNIEVPKFARSTVAAGINSNWDIGKLILEHPQGKFQRNMTARGYDVFMEGQGKEFDAIMKATVWLNATPEMRMRASPRTLEQAELELRAHWAAWRAENLKPLPDINKIEKINQDFIRKWPKVVTHVKTPYGWQQVIHTDLHNYLMNSALRTAHVAAFREQFPNTQSGHRKLAKLDREVRSELGVDHVEDWNALIKTMQGRPTDSYNRFWITGPGKNWAEAGRALNDTAMSLVRRGVLTGQMVVQVPETISAPFVFFSAKNVLRSLVRFRALLPTMISTGQVNKLVYNFSIDPANPIRSGFRFAGNVISKAYAEHFLNELQGKWFSANATVAVERLLNGEMSKRELADIKETFINTGFTPEQASRMLAGDAELLEAFQRRLPTWAVGENKLMAEGSKIAANRLFNSIFRFQMYPMTKMNQLKIILERVAETSKYGDKSEKYAARMRLAKFIGGTTFQGAFLALLYSYFSGGKEGAEMKAREAADEPVRFLTEGFLGAMGGPLYLVWSGARWGGWTGIGEQATRVVFPYAVGAEIVEASAGVGKYKDMDAWDRTAKFFSQKAPGFRMMRTMISEWALGESSPKLEANLKALSQWKRDNWKNKKFPEGPEYNREFRINMKKAYQAVIDEDPEARAKAILAAAGIKTSQGMEEGEADEAIRQSFRQRLVLVNPETGKPLNADEEESLRKRIGDEALWRLKVFDEMLRDLASEPVL